MDKSLFSIYKLPLLISGTLAVVILAIGAIGQPITMAAVFIGCFLGTFVLDMEYVINAAFLETQSDFSKTLMGFVKHSDWSNALKYIYYHKEESKENSLNSALFQMVLAFMSIFVMNTTVSLLAKALILCVFAQSIYVLFEYYFKDRTDDWFWALKVKPNKQGVHVYAFVLLLIFSYCLSTF
jgi:hypothetical protein